MLQPLTDFPRASLEHEHDSDVFASGELVLDGGYEDLPGRGIERATSAP
jgi:hypothetical protein